MISVIIPNYNGKKYLLNCIKSLEKSTYRNFEIIVVDNNSKDGSREYLETEFPNIKLVKVDYNSGFSYAVNRGIESSNGKYVFLLNNDTVIDVKALEELLTTIESDDNIFSVSSKMIQYYNKSLIDDAGDNYSIFGIAVKMGWNHPISEFDKKTEIFSSCAGAAIYRKEIFNQIGLFDESFFAYMEDVDIGYRAKLYGYKNIFEPKAVVEHIVSGTLGINKSSFKTRLSARNNIYVIYKNMPFVQIVINSPFLIIGLLLKWLMFSYKGFGSEFIAETMKAIFNSYKSVKKETKNIKMRNILLIELELIKNVYYFLFETGYKIMKKR